MKKATSSSRKPSGRKKKLVLEDKNLIAVDAQIDTTPIEDWDNVGPLIILEDSKAIANLVRYAEIGGSLGSIAARLKIPQGVFFKWVAKGQDDQINKKVTPYSELWELLSVALSDARLNAETILAIKDPKYYLTHGPGKLLGDDWSDVQETKEDEEGKTLKVSQDIIAAMKLLRLQGIDLNEIIDNDKLTTKSDAPSNPEESLLERNGIVLTKGLPTELANVADNLDRKLKLEHPDML